MRFIDALQQSSKPLLISAPLASISHRGFRSLIDHYGNCDFFVNEMISSDALVGGSQYEDWYTDTQPHPERTVIQLLGASIESLVAAAKKVRELPCAGIDINMGCSAPALLRKGSGARWLDKPLEAADLVKAVLDVIGEKGLSVKLRLPNEDLPGFIEFCMALESAGVGAITFHPRLRTDPWARPAKKHHLPTILKHLTIPIIANGDITSLEDVTAYSMLCTNAQVRQPAGFMIGRASVARPWIFSWISGNHQGHDRLSMIKMFHNLLEAHQPKDFWISRAKKFHTYSCKNLTFGSRLSARIQTSRDYSDIVPLIEEYFTNTPQDQWDEFTG